MVEGCSKPATRALYRWPIRKLTEECHHVSVTLRSPFGLGKCSQNGEIYIFFSHNISKFSFSLNRLLGYYEFLFKFIMVIMDGHKNINFFGGPKHSIAN